MRNTTNKYMMVLQYICGQQSFHSKETMLKFKVTNNFLTAGKDMGIFKRVGRSEYAWNLNRPPLMSDVNGMMVRIRAYNKTYELKPKQQGQQLTIKPLKRVERIAPVRQPVQAEEQHTPYPIMDIVIAFLAGMIAAGFVSLIWK